MMKLLGFDRDVARRQWVADVQCPACGNPGEMAITDNLTELLDLDIGQTFARQAAQMRCPSKACRAKEQGQ